ncbi:MAG: plastocyanin/azurin family copper-binding protein [Gemmatimonadota bacterium]
MARTRFALSTLLILTLACGAERSSDGAPDDAPAAGGSAAPATPAADGDVIEIKLITDEQGNRFEPAAIEAEQGDILRLVLVSGVHNLHFLPDSNPGATDLPPASEMLQLPGQTLDIPVTMKPGHYFFQCDPHALLGMVGHLEVED